MICKNCRKFNPTGNASCRYCGTVFNSSATTAPEAGNNFFSIPGSLKPGANTAPVRRAVRANPYDAYTAAPMNAMPMNTAPANTAPMNAMPMNTAPANTASMNAPPMNDPPYLQFCQNCGAEMQPDSCFCTACGSWEYEEIEDGAAAAPKKNSIGKIMGICGGALGVVAIIVALILYFMPKMEVGDIIEFGSYEQDGDLSNGAEPIEWQVLAVEDDRALVVSKYALDCKTFGSSMSESMWYCCSLRTWLNGSFMDNAFSITEKERIVSTNVSADTNPNYSSDAGKNTTDYVFVLSAGEACKYFASDEERKCELTDYAIQNGAWTTSRKECWYWARTPGRLNINSAVIDYDGSIYYEGTTCEDDKGCVRPAMWITLK